MDLLDFDGRGLYFEDPLPAEVEDLLLQAAALCGDERCETKLWRAWSRAPRHLTVLVALYRFFFFSHRLEEGLEVAQWAMATSAERLGLPADWEAVNDSHLPAAAARSFGLLRFYLLTLKATAVLYLRLGRKERGLTILRKIGALDPADRLGANVLLQSVQPQTSPPHKEGDIPVGPTESRQTARMNEC